MFLTYRYRLYPLRHQLTELDHHLSELSFLWNFALEQRREHWDQRHATLTYLDQQADLKRWRAFDTDGLGRLSYDVARDTLQRLDLAFRAFFRRVKAGISPPGFPRRHRETSSFTFVVGDTLIVPGPRETWRIKLPNVGAVPIRLHRPIPPGAVAKAVTVQLDASAWYASIALSTPDPPPALGTPPTHPVGVDLGLAHLATLSDGARVEPPKFFAKELVKLGRLQRALARKQRGSHRYAQQRERVASCQAKIRRRRRWHAHQMALDWVRRHDLIVFEDLDAANLIEGNPRARSLSDASWGELRQMTSYKAALRSRRTLLVPPEGTSQTCSSCGRSAATRLGLEVRLYECGCGLKMDRDENASRNILARGLTLLSKELRRSASEWKREEGGAPLARVGRQVYQRRRLGPMSRESPEVAKPPISGAVSPSPESRTTRKVNSYGLPKAGDPPRSRKAAHRRRIANPLSAATRALRSRTTVLGKVNGYSLSSATVPSSDGTSMASIGKIAVLGAGNIGGTLAQRLAEADLASEVVLVDIIDGLPQGKALDIQESAPILGFSTRVTGSVDLAALRDASIVIETAGLARKPGMSRSDLLVKNAEILRGHALAVRTQAPEAVVLVVTNPVDVMSYWFRKVSGLPAARVFGESGSLDTARFRTFVADALHVSSRDVTGFVLGTHGDTMVPILSLTSVNGVPLRQLLPEPTLEAIVDRTRKGGGEIVELLKMGSAYYAPTASQAELVASIARDEHRVLPVTAALDGPYGLHDLYLGVPAQIGRSGIERIFEIDLSAEERRAFLQSAEAVRKDLAALSSVPVTG